MNVSQTSKYKQQPLLEEGAFVMNSRAARRLPDIAEPVVRNVLNGPCVCVPFRSGSFLVCHPESICLLTVHGHCGTLSKEAEGQPLTRWESTSIHKFETEARKR